MVEIKTGSRYRKDCVRLVCFEFPQLSDACILLSGIFICWETDCDTAKIPPRHRFMCFGFSQRLRPVVVELHFYYLYYLYYCFH